MRTLFRILIFLLPTQLAFHLWPYWAFISGIRVDYLAPAVYLTDIIAFGIIVLFAVESSRLLKACIVKHKLLILFLLVFTFLNIWVSQVWQVALLGWVKILELALLAYIVRNSNFHFKQDFLHPLSWSLIFVCFVGIAQFVISHSTGLFYIFGERTFSKFQPGIATQEFLGKTYLRSYSVFSHPNSLAGYLLASLPFILDEIAELRNSRRFFVFVFVLCVVQIVTTFSFTGLLAFVVLTSLFIGRNKSRLFKSISYFVCCVLAFGSIFLPVLLCEVYQGLALGFASKSIFQRVILALFSGELFSTSPLVGIGIKNFIVELPVFDLPFSVTWLLQPVHNIFLLVLAETGVVGFMLFFFVLLGALRNSFSLSGYYTRALAISLLVIVVTGFADHYWLTLQQNQLLLAVILGYSLKAGN